MTFRIKSFLFLVLQRVVFVFTVASTAFAALITTVTPTLTAFAVSSSTDPFIMGYWENWAQYGGYPMPNNAAGQSNSKLSAQMTGLTAIAYAFVEVADDGTIQFFDAWSDLSPKNTQDQKFCSQFPKACPRFPNSANFGNFAAFARAPVKHRFVSVGGAGHDGSFQSAFNNADSINRFVTSLKALVDTYGIDGIDLDYEPVGGIPDVYVQSFMNLVAKMRQAMPQVLISYTTGADQYGYIRLGQANWQKLSASVNYIQIMGYDIHGAYETGNPYTNLHSPLFDAPSQYSDDNAITTLLGLGVPSSKVILGMPFYGRGEGGVNASGLGQKFNQSFRGDLDDAKCSLTLGAWNVCTGMITYQALVDRGYKSQPVSVNGNMSGVFTYDSSQKVFISYEDPSSVTVKSQYAINKKLGGVMFWALRHDTPVDNSASLLLAVDKAFGITPNSGGSNPPSPPTPPGGPSAGSVTFVNNNFSALGTNDSIGIIVVEESTGAWVQTGLILAPPGRNSVTKAKEAFGPYAGKLDFYTVNLTKNSQPQWPRDYRLCTETASYSQAGAPMTVYTWNNGSQTDCSIGQ